MRTISLWQPWAMLVVLGYKKFETRHWDTAYRGDLLIHAAKKKSGAIHQLCVENNAIVDALRRAGYTYHSLPRGGLVGKVYLGNTFSTVDATVRRWLLDDPDEKEFGNFAAGRYAWMLSNPCVFDTLYEEVGRQGFWDVEPPYTFEDALLEKETTSFPLRPSCNGESLR